MSYKDKLRKFNSTDKYRSELYFLFSLISVESNKSIILDYGCGLGKAMDMIDCDGFDVNLYYEGNRKTDYFLGTLPEREYSDIYFFHSLAHIPNIKEVLMQLKIKYNPRITVITPNRHWLMMQSNRDYKPDPTVHKHYTMIELNQLLKESGYEIGIYGQFGEEANMINERIFTQTK